MIAPLSKTERSVLGLLACSLFGKGKVPELTDEEWQEVFRECRAQSVDTLAYHVAAPCLSGETAKIWKHRANTALVNNMRVAYEHSAVETLFSENGVPHVIMKGCASASYYPRPELRAMGDVDVLVPLDLFDGTKELMLENGYVLNDGVTEKHIGLKGASASVELHHNVSGAPKNSESYDSDAFLSGLLRDAKVIKGPCGNVRVPSDRHHGILILLHMVEHMISSGIGLRHLCDWAVFAGRMGEGLPDLLENDLRELGLWTLAQTMTAACSEFLGLPEQSWCGCADKELAEELVSDIMHSGNFGSKKSGCRDGWLLHDPAKSGVNTSRTVPSIIRTASDAAKRHWPIAEKSAVMRFILTIYAIIRYAFRLLTGKREKLSIAELKKSAGDRRSIYERLRLYEPDSDSEKSAARKSQIKDRA